MSMHGNHSLHQTPSITILSERHFNAKVEYPHNSFREFAHYHYTWSCISNNTTNTLIALICIDAAAIGSVFNHCPNSFMQILTHARPARSNPHDVRNLASKYPSYNRYAKASCMKSIAAIRHSMAVMDTQMNQKRSVFMLHQINFRASIHRVCIELIIHMRNIFQMLWQSISGLVCCCRFLELNIPFSHCVYVLITSLPISIQANIVFSIKSSPDRTNIIANMFLTDLHHLKKLWIGCAFFVLTSRFRV